MDVGCEQLAIQWSAIAESDWANNWKAHWHPQAIGDRILIYPEWLAVPDDPGRVLIRLNPGAAFGTGEHATTQLCLKALETRLPPLQEQPRKIAIADIGCGSGILAIAALRLGCEQAYGVDTDPLAVDCARRTGT